jgi:hypothetical protein
MDSSAETPIRTVDDILQVAHKLTAGGYTNYVTKLEKAAECHGMTRTTPAVDFFSGVRDVEGFTAPDKLPPSWKKPKTIAAGIDAFVWLLKQGPIVTFLDGLKWSAEDRESATKGLVAKRRMYESISRQERSKLKPPPSDEQTEQGDDRVDTTDEWCAEGNWFAPDNTEENVDVDDDGDREKEELVPVMSRGSREALSGSIFGKLIRTEEALSTLPDMCDMLARELKEVSGDGCLYTRLCAMLLRRLETPTGGVNDILSQWVQDLYSA